MKKRIYIAYTGGTIVSGGILQIGNGGTSGRIGGGGVTVNNALLVADGSGTIVYGGAISGNGGHNKTFRVACNLTHPYPRGFGLSLEQAWPLMKEWNEQCEPEWTDAEILHKLEDALKKRN